jgi:hypothetical protein cdifQ_04001674
MISKNIDCCRFVYNQTLVEASECYKETKHFTTKKDRSSRLVSLKKEFPWLKEVDSAALQQSVRDFNKAFDSHFKNPSKFGYPNFKSKKYSKLT